MMKGRLKLPFIIQTTYLLQIKSVINLKYVAMKGIKMANYDVSIYAELHMVEINTKEGLDIIIPINVDEACQIFKGKRFEVVSATSDCNMDLSYEDGSNRIKT